MILCQISSNHKWLVGLRCGISYHHAALKVEERYFEVDISKILRNGVAKSSFDVTEPSLRRCFAEVICRYYGTTNSTQYFYDAICDADIYLCARSCTSSLAVGVNLVRFFIMQCITTPVSDIV